MNHDTGAAAPRPARGAPSVALALLLPLALLSGCGGGSGEIQGTITGLDADGLELSDGTDTLTVASGATSFTFSTVLDENDTYAVTVTKQPTGLSCSVANGSGTVSADSVINVAVACTPVFSISGTIVGLTGEGLVLSDATDSIDVDADAATFAFPTRLAKGAAYEVSVTTQPGGQTCTLTNGTASSTVNAAVTNLEITCRD